MSENLVNATSHSNHNSVSMTSSDAKTDAYGSNPVGAEQTPQTPAQAPTEETTLLAGKFSSQEDLEKAYLELQTKLGAAPKEETPTQEEAPAAEEGSIESMFQAATEEFNSTGDVSTESIDKMVELGVPRQLIESYISNAKSEQESIQQDILNSVGGQEGFDRISKWSENNLTQEEKDGYNKMLETGDPAQVKFALNQLQQRMGAPKHVMPDSNAAPTGGDVYESRQQMVNDMKDPRYDKDPAFRNMVMAKMARSRR